MPVFETVLILFMVGTNAIFAAYEIALASVTLGRLQVLAHEGRRGAQTALRMKQNMEASLAVVQLGITLVGAIAAATGGAGAEESIAPWIETRFGIASGLADILGIAVVVLPLTVLTIIFGELVPKVFTLRNKEWVCLRLSPPMQVFSLSVWPAVRFLEINVLWITRLGERIWAPAGHSGDGPSESTEIQELRAVTSLARMSRLIGHQEEKIILGAARLSARRLREIMWPADSIRMLNADDSLADALVTANLDMHTRFPITECEGDPQRIIGYANFKDIVASLKILPGEATVRHIARSLPSFNEGISISAALESLMRDHQHISLVRGDGGSVTGLVTLEDIIEELLGDIKDEYDRLPAHLSASGSGWIAGGGLTLDQLRRAAGIDLVSGVGESRQLSEWIEKKCGAPLVGGEVIDDSGIRVVVRKIRRGRVLEAHVRKT